ncbi:MBL fold metallo-hydrolase [Dictyoglomus thermophilum]|uniref:Metal-dependent hydrolases of the beta-lactamase superfamily II n=1 Tax=Dictyoglomus thermophilum (strain ATCC 35947 / DSM 3960 / H-6-12) TaxID=309799 RepID=B5YBG4_DICT6|nr:MBL fold metallo-hydrolase [Dictyoglomus thermophilum]ACI19409.1 metal-dependent hydrolases of the beta-lactamase superfamily II [Dictyoglomus thermophilum H-6-12]
MSQSYLTNITILCDDRLSFPLFSEHGFSVLIERRGEEALLFDTGGSDVFIKNAKILGKDLTKVENIVISHGHYDHAGGLKYLAKFDKKYKVYLRREALLPKYSGDRFTGIDWDSIKKDFDFIFVEKDIEELEKGIYIFGSSPLRSEFNSIDPNFYVINEKGEKVKDKFEDELSLVIDEGEGIILITGCAHRGIVNIVDDTLNKFNKRINLLIGGFHLYKSSEEKVKKVVDSLKGFNIGKILPYHCTGEIAIKLLDLHN